MQAKFWTLLDTLPSSTVVSMWYRRPSASRAKLRLRPRDEVADTSMRASTASVPSLSLLPSLGCREQFVLVQAVVVD